MQISVDSNDNGDGSVHCHYDTVISGLGQAKPLILMDFANQNKVFIDYILSFDLHLQWNLKQQWNVSQRENAVKQDHDIDKCPLHFADVSDDNGGDKHDQERRQDGAKENARLHLCGVDRKGIINFQHFIVANMYSHG